MTGRRVPPIWIGLVLGLWAAMVLLAIAIGLALAVDHALHAGAAL